MKNYIINFYTYANDVNEVISVNEKAGQFFLCIFSSLILLFFMKYIGSFFIKNKLKWFFNFNQVLFFEFSMIIKNAISNFKNVKNKKDFNLLKDKLEKILKEYGFFIINKYLNLNVLRDVEFNCYYMPIIVTLYCNLCFICFNNFYDFYSQLILNFCLIAAFIVIIYCLYNFNFSRRKCSILNINNFLKNIVEKIEINELNYDLDLDILSEENIIEIKNNLNDYYKSIDKILKVEKECFKKYKQKEIDIFNFDFNDESLKNKYNLNDEEINSYNVVKKYRQMYFDKNSI